MSLLHLPSLRSMNPSQSSQSSQSTSSSPNPPASSITSARSRKQLTLFLAGASFFTFSTLITRRSLRKRHIATIPRFYQPSNAPPRTPINGAFEAFEALNIATINVASFMMMMTGGFLWAFDISSLEDMRRKVRGGLGVDGSGRGEQDVEEEFEEWLATVLERKKGKEEGKREEVLRNERGRER